MKKQSKNFKALYSRFILLVIFVILVVDGVFAQCTDSNPVGCHTSLDFDPSCYATYSTAGDVTALRTSGIKQVFSVPIKGSLDVNITSMTITDIIIKNAACETIDGPYTAATFPSVSAPTGYGITFQNSVEEMEVRIFVTNPPPGAGINYAALPVGSHINFIVRAFNGATPIATRRYTFVIVGDSYIVGDPHITTVEGVRYDFQAVGEFTVLSEGSTEGLEIQIRHTAVATNGPITDSYSGLTTCVSLNTAVAARVGTHRVTYQPNINGKPDSSGMQLRVDGKLTTLGENGIDLGSGGRIVKASAGAGIEIDFPDGTSLVATSHWWSHYSVWYLNVNIYHTGASKGIMGALATNDTTPGIATSNLSAKSWLPALPDGSSLGPMPRSLHDRFVQLYTTFADAWRVTDQTSLFDYASGTSTATFTNKNWPAENPQSCSIPGQTPLTPIELAVAQQLAAGIVDSNLRAFAIIDVMVTGEPTFAKAYLVTQQIHNGTTTTILKANNDTSNNGDSVTFTAVVSRKFMAGIEILTGSVEFTVDGKKFETVKLEANGLAVLTTTSLNAGQHQIAAKFIPDSGGSTFSSVSHDITHTVLGGDAGSIWTAWWFWLILIALILIIILLITRKKKSP